jgi:hypothetical protein
MAAGVRVACILFDHETEIEAWRSSLPADKRATLNNPQVIIRSWRRSLPSSAAPRKAPKSETYDLILAAIEASAGKSPKQTAQQVYICLMTRRPPPAPPASHPLRPLSLHRAGAEARA